jgi:predicted 2-oxoglutarate/Fe(II)-dependent dioxygenase YbiX
MKDTSYYQSDRFPFIGENFLGPEDCRAIIEYTEANLDMFETHLDNDFWSKRVVNVHHVADSRIQKLMLDTNRAIGQIVQSLTVGTPPMYPDTIQIVRWYKGFELTPHADAENPGEDDHPFPWRDFASVLYLNDDYVGGEIHWPHKGMEIKPRPGMLAIFPGTYEFLHGVREVTEGVRYTLPSFFSRDPSHRVVL